MISHLNKIAIHTNIQQRAVTALNHAASFITEGVTEQEIVAKCTQLLKEHNLPNTWYYTVPVLAYVGDRTRLSMSGRAYQPTNVATQHDDVVTIAFSPIVEDCWAAIARTFYLHNGKVVNQLSADSIYYDISQFQQDLHRELAEIAKPEMSFDDIYIHFNQRIVSAGYVNLDYHGNLGHSLENDLSKRRFIEKHNVTRLRDCEIFAFETHIGKAAHRYGSKHENIFYFENDKLIAVPAEQAK